MTTRTTTKVLLYAGLTLAALRVAPAHAEAPLPQELKDVRIAEKLGRRVDRSLTFVDHTGKQVQLGDYLRDGKPVLLTLNYYRCPQLCSLLLNALVTGLRGLDWTPGDQYRVVTVSIDPKDTAEIARRKRASYLRSLGKQGADAKSDAWPFLVGAQANVRKLADAVGFKYRYLPKQDQYAHPAAIFFLSAEGKVSRYLYGIQFPARSIKFALVDASEGRVGSTIDKIILSCFHYDETVGAYGPFAFGIMRIAGALTAMLIATMLIVLWRRERSRRKPQEAT